MLDIGILEVNTSKKSLPFCLDKFIDLADAHLGVHVWLYANGEVAYSAGRNFQFLYQTIYISIYISWSVYFFCKEHVHSKTLKVPTL